MTLATRGFIPFQMTVLSFICASLVCGCSESASKTFDASQQATISGKVTLDGSKPVPLDSNITFYCAEKGANATGKVDAIGAYSVKAIDKVIGLPAGRYTITVRPAEAASAKVGTDDYKKTMMMGGTAPKEEPKSDIPEKFHAMDKTPIVLEVKPGANTIDLDLSKL